MVMSLGRRQIFTRRATPIPGKVRTKEKITIQLQKFMNTKIKPIPDGFHSVTPYLIVKDAAKALEFYKRALGAVETVRMPGPGGKIMHAEIKLGDSMIMLADECPEMDALSPQTVGGSPIFLALYVEDVDALTKQAIAAGAKVVRPVQNQFYGDRSGTVVDPFGHRWTIGTHIEDVSPEEMQKRMEAMAKQSPPS
jgi:PhnB protein